MEVNCTKPSLQKAFPGRAHVSGRFFKGEVTELLD